MKELSEARREVLSGLSLLPSLTVSISESLNRVTAEPVIVREALPPFDNSAMDGYAVIAADTASQPVELVVNEDVPAGSTPTMRVESGTATRIMTGAPMPEGADTVVKVEETESEDAGSVTILKAVERGANVRPTGADMVVGSVMVEKGVRLTPRHLGLLASAGVAPVVSEKPRVAILSTGDEVVNHMTESLEPGKIRDSNRLLLHSMLDELGVTVVDLGIIGDDLDELRSVYAEAATKADLIISTGGVSMGEYDFVKEVLAELGSVEFWKVAMKPGKPFAYGSVEGTPLFGLPGNPVSTFVSFEQFVRPALLYMMGATKLLRTRLSGVIGEDVETDVERDVFLRVLLAHDKDGSFVAVRSGLQGSSIHSSLVNADAFAVIPVGVGSLCAGDDVTLEMFRWPEGRSNDE